MTASTPAYAPILEVAPSQPTDEAIARTVQVLGNGGVIALPTDTLYGLACLYGDSKGAERIQAMRGFDKAARPLTFLLPDIGELPKYAVVGESAYAILRKIFPGPYCAELGAGPAVPEPFLNEDRRTIGVRIPATALCEKLLWAVGKPLLTATAKTPSGDVLHTAGEIKREYGRRLDLILDAGSLSGPPSTVVSLAGDWVTVLREGRGPANKLIG
ncbi:MAG: threonylcarbamoyl-AMP synthase [Deltaproteobacteria bacterium]|jgi:tRNA threonylcarbamoyl adenosine modification protein (Sua5/YciO/YrdC/YwlC family)|nr:threonylcarbamoyl-AMP synthase [Deltaproteobacteria bacterium]